MKTQPTARSRMFQDKLYRTTVSENSVCEEMGRGGGKKQTVCNLLVGSFPPQLPTFFVRLPSLCQCYPAPLDIHWGRTHSTSESGSGRSSQNPFKSGQMEPRSLSCCGSFHSGHNRDYTRAQPALRGRPRQPAVLGNMAKAAAAKTSHFASQLGSGGSGRTKGIRVDVLIESQTTHTLVCRVDCSK